jgi:hypothetical protein
VEINFGNIPVKPASEVDKRLAILLWGKAGCGKTTLAATAPGKKLWILFDPDGASVLAKRDDVLVADLSGEKHTVVERFKDDNPFNLEKVLKENEDIETVVFDSATAFAVLCAENAVANVKSATVENLGLKGYGHRSAIVLRALTALMRLTKRMNRHFIIITHEDTPEKNEQGVVLQITAALGGKMTSQVGMQLSEIWHMEDTGQKRRIQIRPCRFLTPMKTRMFKNKDPEFDVTYDALTNKGEGIANWYTKWCEAGGEKIDLPK